MVSGLSSLFVIFLVVEFVELLIPVAVQSKAWVCVRSLAVIMGSNPAGGIDVCLFECCVLSGRDLCVELITRPENLPNVMCPISVIT